MGVVASLLKPALQILLHAPADAVPRYTFSLLCSGIFFTESDAPAGSCIRILSQSVARCYGRGLGGSGIGRVGDKIRAPETRGGFPVGMWLFWGFVVIVLIVPGFVLFQGLS